MAQASATRGRSERIESKATRYLAEGRLTVRERVGRRIEATCRGSAPAPYKLGHDADGGWWCDCPAFRDCAHLYALKLVVALPPVEAEEPMLAEAES